MIERTVEGVLKKGVSAEEGDACRENPGPDEYSRYPAWFSVRNRVYSH